MKIETLGHTFVPLSLSLTASAVLCMSRYVPARPQTRHGLTWRTFQAVALSVQQEGADSVESYEPNWLTGRRHAAFLFGTPHFDAGLAEWAVMSARRLGIPCKKTAQLQDWSELKVEVGKIVTMQSGFRE